MLLVAERNGPTMLARIGMMRAINRLETKPTQATRQRRAKAYGSCVRPGSMRAAFFLTNPDCCHQSTARLLILSICCRASYAPIIESLAVDIYANAAWHPASNPASNCGLDFA
jgi:hypothetical protein